MHTNAGYHERGLALARRFERVFADAEVVVSPSASCVGYLRENGVGLDGRLAELTEFLVEWLGVEDVGATFPHRVTLHPTCHSLRLLGVGDRPRRLLERVRGIDLVELGDAVECCGFGGTFAVKIADTSMAMLSDKLRHVLNTRAEVCTAADNSCLMQIGGALCRNLGKATSTIRAKRAAMVEEVPDWEALRSASAAIKARAMATLPAQLERLETSVTRARAGRCTGRAMARRPRAATCARSFGRCRWRSRGRTSAWPRPARSASWSPRATGACASRSRGS